MAKQLTEEEKAFMTELEMVVAQMKEEFNGCPLFADRDKGELDELTGQQLHIEDLYPLNDYHCIVFEEIPKKFYLTGGGLKDLCNNYPPKFVVGRLIELQPKVKTKSRRDFRPVKVLA